MPHTVLITGGAGYIGSHVVAVLLSQGHRVVILDDFSNAADDVPERIARTGAGQAEVVRGDVRDPEALNRVFARGIDAVIHLAGLKAVGESVAEPLRYYAVNVCGATALFEAMVRHGVERLVFSSTATVYGEPETVPIPEDAPLWTTNPYAQTKLVIERMISDLVATKPGFAAMSLRYFNPVGAHPSALLGEDPTGVPNNLFPYIAQTAAGLRERVRVFGKDYPTRDGTGMRDYIHVMDLAEGHVAALSHLIHDPSARGLNRPLNLGRGEGVTVLEALAAFAAAAGHEIPYEIAPRRPGDVPVLVADPQRAAEILGWEARRCLDAMCRDHWAFQRTR